MLADPFESYSHLFLIGNTDIHEFKAFAAPATQHIESPIRFWVGTLHNIPAVRFNEYSTLLTHLADMLALHITEG